MEILAKNLSKKGLLDYFNQNWSKKDGTKFTYSNISQYTTTGMVPAYIGKDLYVDSYYLQGGDIKAYAIIRDPKRDRYVDRKYRNW